MGRIISHSNCIRVRKCDAENKRNFPNIWILKAVYQNVSPQIVKKYATYYKIIFRLQYARYWFRCLLRLLVRIITASNELADRSKGSRMYRNLHNQVSFVQTVMLVHYICALYLNSLNFSSALSICMYSRIKQHLLRFLSAIAYYLNKQQYQLIYRVLYAASCFSGK
jgi:hypothetical protein